MRPRLLLQELTIPSPLPTSKEKCFGNTLLKTSLVADVLSGWRFLGLHSSPIPPTLLLWAGLCFLGMQMLNPRLQELRGEVLGEGVFKEVIHIKGGHWLGPESSVTS